MNYKSNKSMVAQHVGRIAGCQHHAWKIRKTARPVPLDFDQWFLKGVRFYESKGFSFDLIQEGETRIVRISKAGKSKLRTLNDFEREFQEDYLPKFY